MKVLDRLAASEVIGPLLIGTITFVVLIVGHLLFLVIRPVVERGVPLWVVLRFVGYQVPNAVALALPVSMLLASALAIHRMARDNEIVAMRAAGVPLVRLLRPVWAVGLAASAASFVIAEYVQPRADRRAEAIVMDVLTSRQTLALQSGKFVGVTEDIYVLPGAVNDRTGMISDLKAFMLEPNGAVRLIRAPRAYLEGEKLVLERPSFYRLDESGGLTKSQPASTATIRLPQAIEAWGGEQRTRGNMSVSELATQIRRQRETNPELARPLLLELHSRLSLAFACLAFSLIGAPLALLFRGGRSVGGALVAIFYAFVYYMGMLWARMLGDSGALAPAVAAWLPNAVTLGLGAVLLWRRY